MTKQDLFRVIIRFLGLYFLIGTISNTFTMLPMFIMTDTSIDASIVVAIIALIIAIGFFILVIGYPDIIINVLGLIKGFDDNRVICNNESLFKLINIILFSTGGYLIVENTIPLVVTVYNQISASKNFTFISSDDCILITKQIIFILIGSYIITNYINISQFFQKETVK